MQRTFPSDFLWGVATSAHQVEGNNTNADLWLEEQIPGSPFVEPSGIALDQWNLYKADIELLASLGLKCYRFSIEWARIEPGPDEWSDEALNHYLDVCDECIRHGMEPVITLHHFTSPQWLMRYGGWRGDETPQLFARYVEKVIAKLGHRVRYVVTMNECNIAAVLHDYVQQLIAKGDKVAIEKLSNNAWRRVAAERCGVEESQYCSFIGAMDPKGVETVKSAHRAARAVIRRLAPHIKVGFSLSLQQAQVRPGAEKYALDAWQRKFRQWLPLIADDDFVSTQTYTRTIYDVEGKYHVPAGSPTTLMKFEFAPEALAEVLRTIASEVDKPILISENGAPVADDKDRVEFIGRALAGVHQCVADGIKVLGYFYWSGFDNFEWYFGYHMRFGIIAVDRATMKRTPKESAYYLGAIARTGMLPDEALVKPQPDAARELRDILKAERQRQDEGTQA
ncbi:MAG TPA: family 1 glycosylhydrolase [Roseateles sp.]|uniref:glycoside hydrolase family 1 protein n=1 Tax=Roseateles sp. TaxID=1971397 RepID=UPI002EDAD632